MDPFELIRIKAAALNARLVAAGVDAMRPGALVDAAAAALGLELAWLDPSDPALKGARALFDDQSGTILAEDRGDASARALLVAHELGHADMHSGSSACSAHDVDPTRSVEQAPVGLQRVEDYGARERRELQANVFAREFVLPRATARRLHLDEARSASAIAATTGLPLDLVRQQLFDALLLPVEPTTVAPASWPVMRPEPDPSQDRAASHRGSPFQLQAGPGTGKTRTLVKRIVSLIDEDVDPASILVLTFSNRAAGELTERITAAVPDAAAKIWVGTFHAFGLDLVRRHHDRLGLGPDPELFDRSDAIEVLEEMLPILPLVHYRNLWDPAMVLREVISAISRAKDEMVGPHRYRDLAEEMRVTAAADDDADQLEAAEKCLEVAQVYDIYERALRDRGAVDFADLVMRPALLLDEDAAVRAAVRLRHRHVLVDEYQDVNRASAMLLKGIAGDGTRLWVVGDARQSIYRFRGASSANMADFGTDYPGATFDRLQVSYRSTQTIVDAFVAVSARMAASRGMLPLDIRSRDPEAGPPIQIRTFAVAEDEAEGVAASIRELEVAGVRLRDQAVLCRSNARLNEIAVALEARGIPVLHLGSLFERDEVRNLLALMSLAVEPFGEGLVRVGALPRYSLCLQDVHAAIRWLEGGSGDVLSRLVPLAETPGLTPQGREGLRRLAADLDGLPPRSAGWDLLSTYLLDRTDLLRQLATETSVPMRMRGVALWQFLNFVRDHGRPGALPPIQRCLDRVRQLVLLAEERDLRQVPAAALHMDAVRLMTVHGAKGLEFPAVHVPALNVTSFPSNNRGQRCPPPVGMIASAIGIAPKVHARNEHDAEEECLFFVAQSRARTHLRLYLSSRQANGNNRNPSPFLGWLPARLTAEIASPAVLPLPPEAPRPRPIGVVRSGEWRLSETLIRSYDKCPRRFFYTHVLRLGAARAPTAFSRTHDCLYELMEWLGPKRGDERALELAEAAFEDIWSRRGPVDHGFASDYRALASRLVATLVGAGTGRDHKTPEGLEVRLSNGSIVLVPDEVVEMPDGTVVIRRVRTGYRRSDEYDRIEYALYILAGQSGPRATAVEALHLTDGAADRVEMTARKLATRRDRADAMLAGIAAGWYRPDVDAVSCPRCPHFFICASTPEGPLRLD